MIIKTNNSETFEPEKINLNINDDIVNQIMNVLLQNYNIRGPVLTEDKKALRMMVLNKRNPGEPIVGVHFITIESKPDYG